jgi:glucose/arabinose dehydrogenase
MRRLLLALTALLPLAATAPANAAVDPRTVEAGLVRVATGLDQPVALTHPEGDPRLFVVERTGRIRVIKNGVLLETPFLDLSSKVSTSGEGGLLSLAFRPDYSTSGLFYVAFTDANMTLRVVRYHASGTSNRANPLGVGIIAIPHPGNTNHNGGQLAFGPAGFLYIGTGDGGGSGDPDGNAQDPTSLLGKILRINVGRTSTAPYSIPPGNPYATSTVNRREIWLLGLRNPWRFSFDRGRSPDLWIGDVGQGAREEIDKIAPNVGGLNLGWDCREGTQTMTYGTGCASGGYTAPLFEYDHGRGDCAVIGGYVYRGTTYASLVGGQYVFADYCTARLWSLGRDANGALVAGGLNDFGGNILALGRDAAGELYLLSAAGNVNRIVFRRR